MPKFRVISEPYRLDRFSPTVPTHRRIRGDESVQRKVTIVDAEDLFAAVNKATELRDHRKHSITSIEEIYPAEALYFSDEQITAALRQPAGYDPLTDCEKLHPDDYVGQNLYDSADFADTVESVAKILGNTLLPGLSVSMVGDFDDNYTVIDIRDVATGLYCSTTAEVKSLILDRDATGWDGILSIARALIDTAAPLA
jgi:hypothetical protein